MKQTIIFSVTGQFSREVNFLWLHLTSDELVEMKWSLFTAYAQIKFIAVHSKVRKLPYFLTQFEVNLKLITDHGTLFVKFATVRNGSKEGINSIV